MDSDGLLQHLDRIFVPNALDLWLWVVRSKHDHLLASHFRQTKMLKLIRWQFTWLGLWAFVSNYMNSCNVCSRNKPCHHKPYGLLKQSPVPLCPWDSISMDFIEQLLVSNGCSDILVVVDRLTKQAIFIPIPNILNSAALTTLFISYVFETWCSLLCHIWLWIGVHIEVLQVTSPSTRHEASLHV